ncbi:aquaporin, partial [Exiguobacterium sp.]
SFGGTTGYAMNPARDLGPRIAHFILPIHGKGSSNWGYSWIPVLGPVLGGSLGGLFYRSVFTGKDTPAFWIVGLVTIVILGLCYRFGVRPNKTTSVESKSA